MAKKFIKGITTGIGSILKPVRKALQWILGIKEPGTRALEISNEGSDISLAVPYGERMVGGITVHKWVTNSITGIPGIVNRNQDNAYLHVIVAFSHGEIESFEKIFINGEEETEYKSDTFAYFLSRGAPDALAIPEAVANVGNWNNSMRGRNVAYGYFVYYQDKDQQNWSGEPEETAIIKGLKVYDWRTEVFGYSTNNAVCSVDYLLNTIYGRGLPDDEVEYPSWTAAADFCDETTTSTITRTEFFVDDDPTVAPIPITTEETVFIPRYTIAALLDSDQTVFENFKTLLSSFRGVPDRPGGLVGVSVETVGEPEIQLNEDHIVGSIAFGTGGLNDRFNQVVIRFPNAMDRFERDEVVWPPSDSATYTTWLAEDNNKPLRGEFEFNTFSSVSDALQMAEIIAKRSRVDGGMEFNVRGIGRVLRPNMLAGITEPRLGLDQSPIRVLEVRDNENGTYRIKAIEHNNAIYPWSGAAWEEIVGGTWLGDPNAIPNIQNLTLQRDFTYASAAFIRWDNADNAFIKGYEVYVIVTTEGAFNEGERVHEGFTTANSYVIPWFQQTGTFQVSVRAVNRLSRFGQESSVALFLLQPLAPLPTEIVLFARNFEIRVTPTGGQGIGDVWEYDIAPKGVAHLPSPQQRGRSALFASLDADTEYTTYTRASNSNGNSGWVQKDIKTTKDGQLDPVVNPKIDELREELEQRFPIKEQDIDDGAISKQKFADSIEPVTIVEAVPTTNQGATVFNTTDGKLYRWNGTEYIKDVPASDITAGTLNAAITNTNVLTIGVNGIIRSAGKNSATHSTAGFWLGWNGAAGVYQFGVGTPTNGFVWDGAELLIAGDVIARDNIKAGAVSAVEMDVGTLSAITANMGVLNAGTINVAAGGDYVAINDSQSYIDAGSTSGRVFRVAKDGSSFINGASLGTGTLLGRAFSQDAIDFIAEAIGSATPETGGVRSITETIATATFNTPSFESSGIGVNLQFEFGGQFANPLICGMYSELDPPPTPTVQVVLRRGGTTIHTQTFSGSVVLSGLKHPDPNCNYWEIELPAVNINVDEASSPTGEIFYTTDITVTNWDAATYGALVSEFTYRTSQTASGAVVVTWGTLNGKPFESLNPNDFEVDTNGVLSVIGGGGGATNLSVTRTTTSVTVVSSTGDNATIAAASTDNAGVMTKANFDKLAGIAAGATANAGTVTSVSGGDGLTGTVTESGSLAVDATVVRTTGAQTLSGKTFDKITIQASTFPSQTMRRSTFTEWEFGNSTNHSAYGNGQAFRLRPLNADRFSFDEDGTFCARKLFLDGTVRSAGSFYVGGTDPFNSNRMNYDGYLHATRFYTPSSRRLKNIERVVPLDESLQKVVAIGSKGVSLGKYKQSNEKRNTRWLIAEDVQLEMDEAVSYDEKGRVSSLNYDQLVPDLYAAIAAQQKMIDDLREVIDVLRG